jgi:tyrosine-specific transport protein
MASTGLLIAEVSCNLVAKDPVYKNSGILALTRNILGAKEATVSGLVYVFIHYALLIAYIAEAGDIINQSFNLQSRYMGPVLFTSIIGSIVAFGSSTLIEQTNNFFVIIVLVSFAALVSIGLPLVNTNNLLTGDLSSLGATIPVMFVALVYHNIVPSICSLLKYDKKSIQKVIVFGSFIPLLMFLTWNFVILGIGNSGEGFDPVNTLRQGSGNQLVSSFISIFSESAIITSFLGFIIGLMSFYTDVFPTKSDRDLGLYSLVLLPPLAVALYNPNIFLNALDLAGTYGISLLFGAIPCLLSWRLREKYGKNFNYQNFVPFGNYSLFGLLLLTGFVIVQKLI